MVMDTMNAVSALLASQFTTCPVYINNQSEGFTRPSFFINFVNGTGEDMNRWMYDNKFILQIVYFSPLDDYKTQDTQSQLQTYDTLLSMFNIGYVQIPNRAVKITQVTGGPRDAEIYLSIEFELASNKPNNDPNGPYPSIGTIQNTNNY